MEKQIKKQRGGLRANSGRKPSLTKKKPFTIYIDITTLDMYGRTEVRNHLYKSINQLTNGAI